MWNTKLNLVVLLSLKFASSCIRLDAEWKPSTTCQCCIEIMLERQFKQYQERLAATDCKKEQRRMLQAGPPINLSVCLTFCDLNMNNSLNKEKYCLPCPEGHSGEIDKLWYASGQIEKSAKLAGSLEGEERMKWWDDQKSFLISTESDEDQEDSSRSDEKK